MSKSHRLTSCSSRLGIAPVWVVLGVGALLFFFVLCVTGVALFWTYSDLDTTPEERVYEFFLEEGMLDHFDTPLSNVSFSPCGTIAVTSESTGMRLWDVDTGEKIKWLPGVHRRYIMVETPDGALWLAAPMGHNILVWRVPEFGDPRTLRTGGGNVRGMHISPDRTRLLTGSAEAGVRVWDITEGRSLRRLGDGPSTAAGFSPDGSRALTRTDSFAHLWNIETGERLSEFGPAVQSAAFSGEGSYILVSESVGGSVWDAETGEKLRHYGGPDDFVRFSGSGSRVLVQSMEGEWWVDPLMRPGSNAEDSSKEEPEITLHDTKTGEALASFTGSLTVRRFGGSTLSAPLFSPSDDVFMVDRNGGKVELREAETGGLLKTIELPEGFLASHFVQTEQGDVLLATGDDGKVKLYSADDGEPLGRFEPPGITERGPTEWRPPTKAALSPDGSRLFAGGPGTDAWLWDVETGDLLHTIDLSRDREERLRVIRKSLNH